MKKNYTCPVVEVSIFDFSDVVMTSDPGVSLGKNSAAISDFTNTVTGNSAGSAKGIVVQW